MNCVSHQPDKRAGGPSQVARSLPPSNSVILSVTIGTVPVSEPVLEAEMTRRAEVITETLTGIIEEPAAFRYWGLNE